MATWNGTGPNSRTFVSNIKTGERSWQVDLNTTNHSEIKEMQQKLTNIGFSTYGADGTYGNNTKTAVANFQKSSPNPLTGDGYFGKATLNKFVARVGSLAGYTGTGGGTTPTPSVQYAEMTSTGVNVRNAANGATSRGQWSAPARFMVLGTASAGGYSWYKTIWGPSNGDGYIRTDMAKILPSYFTDFVDRMVNIATSFEGHTGTSAWQFSGAWCQSFANAIYKQTGLLSYSGKIPNNSGCLPSLEWFQSKGRWKAATATPVKGDWVYYLWKNDEDKKLTVSHVGIVTSVNTSAKTIDTVEGNRTDGVSDTKKVVRKYGIPYTNYTTSRVIGFGQPYYS